ncbi:MAG: hypothetical protein Q9175_004667 [Cornicularia normoerica]
MGEVVDDTLIRYDQSIEEIFADAPRTGPGAKFSWIVVRRIYGRETQTSGMAIDDIRDIIFNAGMNSNSDLVEWSTSGTDRQKLKCSWESTPQRIRSYCQYIGESVDDYYDEDDDVDRDDEIKMLDMESAAKQAVKETTEEEKALLALFEEYRRTRRSTHGATGMIDFPSGPSDDQMVGEGDQEVLEYLQAFVGDQEEQVRLGSEDGEYEGSAGDDAEGEVDDGQTKGNDNSFLQEEDAGVTIT